MIFGDRSPLVRQYFYVAFTSIDHWLDGKTHALFKDLASPRTTVVQYLGIVMKNFGDTVATKFAYYTETLGFGMTLNRMANVTQACAGRTARCLDTCILG